VTRPCSREPADERCREEHAEDRIHGRMAVRVGCCEQRIENRETVVDG
jgi:hypothetical protein